MGITIICQYTTNIIFLLLVKRNKFGDFGEAHLKICTAVPVKTSFPETTFLKMDGVAQGIFYYTLAPVLDIIYFTV